MSRTQILLGAAALALASLVACKGPTRSLDLIDPVAKDTTTSPTSTVDNGAVRIVEIMPDPYDDDDYAEWFKVQNKRDTAVSLTGWKIMDAENTVWTLDEAGKLDPGAIYKLVSPYTAKLSNDGDTVYLVAPNNEKVQTVAYGPTVEGKSIKP